ncbi:MAG: BamA/TamA family outer membrane protein [Acidobacteriota bacterium]|nr:BamA/TamA family outer membrane protein [Acidobacteriota bacterium]
MVQSLDPLSISRRSRPRHFSVILLFFFILIAAGCKEDGEVQVSGFELQGVESIDESRLRGVLATSKSSRLPWGQKRYFDRARFEADLLRVAAFYADRGFPDARVKSYDVALSDDQKKVKLTLVIEEGEPVLVERIAFTGLESMPADRLEWLKGRLSQKEGQPRDTELLTLSRSIVLDELRDRGYPHASVRMTEAPGAGPRDRVITIDADRGRLSTFGEIEVTGNSEVSARVILEQLTFKPGDRYRLGQLQESTRRLYGLELFQFVTIEEVAPDPASDVVRMRVTVSEGKTRRFRATVGYGSEEHARATANYRHVNFLGGARTAGVEGKWSSLDRGAGVTFGEPNLFSKVALNVRAENWFFSQPLYDLETKGGRATLSRRFGQRGPLSRGRSVTTLSAGYLLEYEDYVVSREALETPSFRPTLISLGLDPVTGQAAGRLSAAVFDASRNTTENLLDARQGYVLSAHVEKAGLGGDYTYLETTAEGRYYLNLNERAVIASRVRGASLGGTDTPDTDIPFFKRYFLGGSQSMRGWGRFEVAPLLDGLPIGGYTSLEGTVEIRVPVTDSLGGVLFLDAGNVAAGTYDFSLRDLKYAAGAGVRYRTPVGPLRFDFGYQLKRIPGLIIDGSSDTRRWRIHFSVGQAF